jgi:hypothetical protein
MVSSIVKKYEICIVKYILEGKKGFQNIDSYKVYEVRFILFDCIYLNIFFYQGNLREIN